MEKRRVFGQDRKTDMEGQRWRVQADCSSGYF